MEEYINKFLGMTCQHLLAMLLTVAVAGLTTDIDCPKYIPGQMPCEKTEHKLYVKAGDSLILNCTCFNKTNGQWTGPNKLPFSTTDHYMPYTHGTYLNPSLNKSKYKVLGGYEDTKCYLRITNFLSDDDGIYICQYFSSSIIYIDVYKIVATRSTHDRNPSTDYDMMNTVHGVFPITEYVGDKSSVNHDGKNTKTETYTFETKHCQYNSRILNSSVWQLIGSLFGGLLFCSICLNIYCLLKRRNKSNSGIVSEIPLEVQYFEIGSIIDNIASIHDVPNNVQESVHSVGGAAPENTSSIISSLEKGSSSESSVHSLSNPQLNVDEYESPYQMIDLENIQPHPYSTICSNMYQNTIIFQKEIRNKQTEHTIQNVKERDPWLIIYK